MSESAKEFTDAKHRLQDLERADRAYFRELARRCDWEDDNDRTEYRRDVYAEERRHLLNILVPDRKCPTCGHLVLESTKWVVSRQRNMAVCRRCFHGMPNGVKERVAMSVTLFPKVETRYQIDKTALQLARARSGLCTRAFAEKAGWSASYQRKLESVSQTVNEATALTLLQVLREAGVVTQDVLQ